MYAICQRDRKKLDEIGDAFGVEKRYTDLREVLKDPDVDVVHINSPIPDHAWMSIAALKAGKHVACTVPMATSVEDCQTDRRARRRDRAQVHDDGDGRLRPRVPLHQGAVRRRASSGKLQFLQASHQQDMDGWPNYWPGLPPMWYATHCVGPMLALTRRRGGIRLLLRLGHDPQGAGQQVQLARSPSRRAHIKFKDSDLTRAHHPLALRHRPPVPREHRRLRLEEVVRVAARRSTSSTSCTRRRSRSRRSRSGSKCPTTPHLPARSRSGTSRPRASTTSARKRTCRSRRARGHGGSHPHLVARIRRRRW